MLLILISQSLEIKKSCRPKERDIINVVTQPTDNGQFVFGRLSGGTQTLDFMRRNFKFVLD